MFVPAGQLRYLAPWSANATPDTLPAWNPLWYDSVGQFFVWRQFSARTLRSGTLPLWNPYEFCGTPFVANSQSAVFYPPNLLYLLLPTERAAGWNAWLHLSLAGIFMTLFLRRLGLRESACVCGSVAFTFSTWQVSWLHLPTFLASSCWLPLLLLLTHRLFERPGFPRAVALGFAAGMCLLAGHLQIAFYVLMATGLFALLLLLHEKAASLRKAGMFFAALALGGMLSAPQVVPSLDLSRRSHRNIPPSTAGYAAYTGYAVPASALITLFLPDFFGNPSIPNGTPLPYFGISRGDAYFNYAEGALYVGLPTLLLAALAFTGTRWRGTKAEGSPRSMVGGFGVLALFALLIALGTAVDALFYFYVPGFGQSGSPGRVLVLWAFALSVLAAFGWNRLVETANPSDSETQRFRSVLSGIGVVLVVGVGCLVLGSGGYETVKRLFGSEIPQQTQAVRQAGIFLLTSGLLTASALRRLPARLLPILPVILLVVDLFANGFAYNPTAAPEEVYPATDALTFLKTASGHDRILPVHTKNWSFLGPKAPLPPNGAMAYTLRDVQGYDSLFMGQYADFMNRLARPVAEGATPPEVGNMLFARNPNSPLVAAAGVRCLVSLQPLALTESRFTEEKRDNLYLYRLTDAPGRAALYSREGTRLSETPTWREDSPTRVTLSFNAASEAVLRLADQYAPGWTATLDEQPVTLEKDDVFRRVAVPAGAHTVSFRYAPQSFRIGLFLMLLAVLTGSFALSAQKKNRLTASRKSL